MPEDASLMDYVSVIYGFVPAVFACVCLVGSLIYRNSSLLKFTLYIAFNTAICEFLKRVFRGIIDSSRPMLSACKSSGMPSGHSSLSIGWITLLLLDLNVQNKLLVNTRLFGVACILLAPVPLSRLWLGDHDTVQVLVGAMLGYFLGTLWFYVVLRNDTITSDMDETQKDHVALSCCIEHRIKLILSISTTTFILATHVNVFTSSDHQAC